jgi:hypothetical protein
MKGRTLARTLLLTLTAASFTACRDSTGPGYREFDPALTQASAQAMIDAFDTPELEQFMHTGSYMNLGSPPVTLALSTARQSVLSRGRLLRTDHAELLAAMQGMVRGSDMAAAAVMPQEVLGKTFIYDAVEDEYVVSERTGAPANGVRFIMYALAGGVIDPSQETGFVEVRDLAPAGASSVGLRLRVVSGTTTYLDYTIALQESEDAASLDVTGYVTNGVTRVNYQTALSMSDGPDGFEASITYAFSVPSRDFSVQGLMTENSEGGELEILVTSNRAEVRYLFSTGETFTGEIYVNGALFAEVTDTEEGPAITGANGNTLTPEQLEVLEELLDLGQGVFFWWWFLLMPVGWFLPL